MSSVMYIYIYVYNHACSKIPMISPVRLSCLTMAAPEIPCLVVLVAMPSIGDDLWQKF
jgi:hypothetical protein